MSDPTLYDDEFFVGYHAAMPPRLRRFLRWLALAIVLVAIVAVGGVALIQLPFAPAFFEFGLLRRYSGRIVERPYPMLVVERPGHAGLDAAVSQYLLVAEGKHGAQAIVAGLAGKPVEVSGSLIFRGNQTMIQVVAAKRSIESTNPVQARPGPPQSLGDFTLDGELVDSKCYLGVMNPGATTPHRGCAVRCLSGGTTPLFVIRDTRGTRVALIPVSTAGAPLGREILGLVGEPLQVTGRVKREGDLLLLEADPDMYRRLP